MSNITFYKQNIDILKIVKIYPAVFIKYESETTEMSLEWVELNFEKVQVISYNLNINYEESQIKIEFQSREDLILAINEIYEIVKK